MGFDLPGIAPQRPAHKKAPAKRKRAALSGLSGSGKAAVGVRAGRRVGTRHPSVGDIIGAGVHNAGKTPAGGGLAVGGPPGAATGRGTSLATKLARTAAVTAEVTAEAHARDPLKQLGKDAAGARDAARGIIGVPGAIYTVGKELVTEGRSPTGKKALADVGKDYERRYGATFRGEPGARKKQLKRQRKEGSFPEILDLASVGVPGNEGVTALTKGLARVAPASKAGRAAAKVVKATEHRPPIRESAGHVKAQKARRTVAGAATTAATDAARKTVQRRAVARASSGKAKLSPRRAAVADGEVAGASEKLAARRARRRVAHTARVERQTADTRIKRELTGRKGGKTTDKTLRRNMQDLPSDAHREALLYAQQYGIRSSAGAKAILQRRVRQLKTERLRKPRTEAESVAHDELPRLEALLKDPAVFDHPDVVRLANAEVRRSERVSGPETGLAPERHELARYQPQADTLGVVRHTKETPHEYTHRVAKVLGVRPPTDAEVAALARAKRISRQAAAVEADKVFRRAVVKAKTDAGASHLARHMADEPAAEFVARVRKAAAEHGLVEPGYTPSRSNAADAAAKRSGLSGNPEQPAGSFAAREGEVFRRGFERKDPELSVGKLAQTVRAGTRLKAESDTLHSEGRRFANGADAAKWMEEHHVDPRKVELVNDPVLRSGSAPASGPARGAYVPTSTTFIVDKGIVHEWDRQHAAAGAIERGAARAQSIQQAILLGASPSWFSFQVLADSITLGAAGGLHKLISANREYRRMSDADRELVDVLIGGNPANDILLDKAGDQLGRMGAVLSTSPTYRKFMQGRRPLTALLRAEGQRAAAFRRAGLAARAAKIDRSIPGARVALKRTQHAVDTAAPGDLARLLADPKAAAAAAEHVNEIMGNFADYTAAERRVVRSIVPFYGFLRYSTRLLFYTLPIDHPYVGLLVAQLGRLSADEARDLVGPDLPYGLSKFYNADGTKAVDFSRASPLLSSLSASTTVGQLGTAFLPPLAALAANQVAGKNLYTGRNYKVQGSASPTEGNDLTPEDRARIAAHELLSWLAPVRAYEKSLPAPQSDDTLPFSRRPLVAVDPKTSNSIEDSTADKAKQARWDRFMGQLLPLLMPQQPTSDAAAGASATQRKAERIAMRTKRAAKRDAIQNDPLARLDFTLKKSKARTQVALDKATGSTTEALNAALERAGITPRTP